MKRRIAYGIVLATLILSWGCQAKHYNEQIGPYGVCFNLSDDTASNTRMNKTINNGEDLDGTTYDAYSIELEIPERKGRIWGNLLIVHYNATTKMDILGSIENSEATCKSEGYDALKSDERIIDSHDGCVVYCFGSETQNEKYKFSYQLDDQTMIGGCFYLNWEKDVLPFLKSLHIKEVP